MEEGLSGDDIGSWVELAFNQEGSTSTRKCGDEVSEQRVFVSGLNV